MGADEFDRLDEHAGGAAARVVDPAVVRLKHLDQQPHDGARRVELAALAALGQRELLEEVLVDLAQHVRGARLGVAHLDVAHEVDHLPKAALVEGGAGVVLGQHAVERRVVALDGGHGVIHQLADRRLTSLPLQVRPSRLGAVPRRCSRQCTHPCLRRPLGPLGEHRGVAFLEGIGDVLKEYQAEHDMLVLGGVHAPAKGVGHPPEVGPVVGGGAAGGLRGCGHEAMLAPSAAWMGAPARCPASLGSRTLRALAHEA